MQAFLEMESTALHVKSVPQILIKILAVVLAAWRTLLNVHAMLGFMEMASLALLVNSAIRTQI
jgi:hypothetical protein